RISRHGARPGWRHEHGLGAGWRHATIFGSSDAPLNGGIRLHVCGASAEPGGHVLFACDSAIRGSARPRLPAVLSRTFAAPAVRSEAGRGVFVGRIMAWGTWGRKPAESAAMSLGLDLNAGRLRAITGPPSGAAPRAVLFDDDRPDLSLILHL